MNKLDDVKGHIVGETGTVYQLFIDGKQIDSTIARMYDGQEKGALEENAAYRAICKVLRKRPKSKQ